MLVNDQKSYYFSGHFVKNQYLMNFMSKRCGAGTGDFRSQLYTTCIKVILNRRGIVH